MYGALPTAGTGTQINPLAGLSIRLLAPSLSGAVAAAQRRPVHPAQDHARPGMPALSALCASAAQQTGLAAALQLASGVLASWAKERPDAHGATFADRLFQHFSEVYAAVPEDLGVAVVLWMATRLATAEPASVVRYLTSISLAYSVKSSSVLFGMQYVECIAFG